jgi:hypothetical protein
MASYQNPSMLHRTFVGLPSSTTRGFFPSRLPGPTTRYHRSVGLCLALGLLFRAIALGKPLHPGALWTGCPTLRLSNFG